MDSAAVITAGIAAVSALVALAALYFTRQQVKIAERQTALQERIREDAAQPYVWADIRMDARQMHLMKLVIHNDGPTVAKDVVVSFDPALPKSIGQWGPSPQSAPTVGASSRTSTTLLRRRACTASGRDKPAPAVIIHVPHLR